MKRIALHSFISLSVVALFACGGAEHKQHDDHADHADHADHMDHADHSENADKEGPKQLDIPEGAKVMFGNLAEGDTINMPFTVKFEVEGIEVEPAGELNEGKGHHHLIINNGFIARGTVVPADSVNIHYGKGQTETDLDLSPGNYQLTMQFADGYHQSYGEQLSATVNIVVE